MELDKLREILDKIKIPYENKSIISENDGINIWYKDYDISVISHKYSYGGPIRTIRDYGFFY